MIKGIEFNSLINNGLTAGTVIVLPGTRWQIPVVCKLKKMGYRVVVFDLYEDQPCYQYADEYRLVDILDKDKCLELAKEFNPIAVVSDECDIAVPTLAFLSKRLDKPSIGIDMAELYTNKFKMREHAQKFGFPTPAYFKCRNIEEALSYYRNFGKKMIIKPLNANSSRGVFSINCLDDIITHFDEAIHFSKGDKSVLLEEYIEGEEFSVDGIKIGDKYFSLEVAHKIHYDNNENLDKSLLFTYSDPIYDYNKLRETNERYVRSTGIDFAITHAEYKYHGGEFYLIEIGARGGGNLMSSVIDPALSGIDAQLLYLKWACGDLDETFIPVYRNDYKTKCACLEFFDVDNLSGVVREIKGVELLEKDDRILSYDFFYKTGDFVEKAHDASSRFGYYIACCDSLVELEILQEKVRKTVVPVITED